MERKLVFFTQKKGLGIDWHVAKKPISQDIGNIYDRTSGLIVDFLYPLYLTHRLVDSNYNDLTQTINKILIDLCEENKKSPALIDPYENVVEMMVELNKCVLNILTTISLFLLKATDLTKSQFGESSDEYRSIESLRKKLHKENLSYRFCYELRNYSQHYGIPINKLAINFSINEKPSLVATIVKSRLTGGSYTWKKTGIATLSELDESFDLIPHVANYVDITNQLFRHTFTACENSITEFNEVVISILENAGCEKTKRFVLGCDIRDDSPDFDIEEVPYTFVKKLEQYLLKLEGSES